MKAKTMPLLINLCVSLLITQMRIHLYGEKLNKFEIALNVAKRL